MAEFDVEGADAAADGGGERSLDGDHVLARCGQGLVGEADAGQGAALALRAVLQGIGEGAAATLHLRQPALRWPSAGALAVALEAWTLGAHTLEAGIWYEDNEFNQARRFYPERSLTAPTQDFTEFLSNPLLTQWETLKGMLAPKTNTPPQSANSAPKQLGGGGSMGLEALAPGDVNAFEGRDMRFEFRDFKLPFTAENFLLSFSLPNFYFHAATAYDILRHNGVAIGKRDFTGPLRLKT